MADFGSHGKDTVNLPDWFEPQTIEFMNFSLEGGKIRTQAFGDVDHDWFYSFVTSPELKNVWLRAKKFFNKVPYRGQIVLFIAIRLSFRPSGEYMSEREAMLWKETFLAKIRELSDFMDLAPKNFDVRDALRNRLSSFVSFKEHDNVDELSESDQSVYHALQIVVARGSRPACLLGLTEEAIAEMAYSKKGHASQFRGRNAERAYFVRKLSRILKYQTGDWKRTTVAEVTSVAFECGYTAKEVVRCTKDLEPPAPRSWGIDE